MQDHQQENFEKKAHIMRRHQQYLSDPKINKILYRLCEIHNFSKVRFNTFLNSSEFVLPANLFNEREKLLRELQEYKVRAYPEFNFIPVVAPTPYLKES